MSTKIKFVTAYSYKSTDKNKEAVDGKSVTIPGQSMTVRELMDKHRAGTMDIRSKFRDGFWEDENDNFESMDLEKVQHADLTELEQLKNEAEILIQRFKKASSEDDEKEAKPGVKKSEDKKENDGEAKEADKKESDENTK